MTNCKNYCFTTLIHLWGKGHQHTVSFVDTKLNIYSVLELNIQA